MSDEKPPVPPPLRLVVGEKVTMELEDPAERYRRGGCWPLCSIRIHKHDRSVICRTCGKRWEAFDWLFEAASSWENISANAKHGREEVARLRKQEADLKREIANLKAQKRRLR